MSMKDWHDISVWDIQDKAPILAPDMPMDENSPFAKAWVEQQERKMSREMQARYHRLYSTAFAMANLFKGSKIYS